MTRPNTWDSIFDGPTQSAVGRAEGVAEPRPERTRTGRRKATAAGKRGDIQGLRALAVVLVILDHVGSWPHGGFVGVDVFFVISGYLITGLLLRSARENSGGRYIAQFYLNRARRILPAAITVLIACWIAASLTFRGARVGESRSDILWSGGFAANIHFAHIGTDYFESTRPASLVQHFWSLAVEEQFYLVWPVIILLVVVFVGRRRSRSLLLLWLVTVATTLGSFAWALHETSIAPTAAYFSPFVRAWELGAGAVLAVTLARWPSITARLGSVRGPLALASIVGIVVSATVIRSTSGFPAPAAAAPVLLTALLIAVGGDVANDQAWWFPLTNPVSRYLGDISYSLYLWHWPVIIIVGALVSKPNDAGLYYALIVLLTLGLSVFSYHFVERPIHQRGAAARTEWRDVAPRASLAALALVVASLALYSFKPLPTTPSFVDQPVANGPGNSRAPSQSVVTSKLGKKIDAALEATSFPKLDPDIDHLGLQAAVKDWAGCLSADQILKSCTFGPATNTKKVLLVGDSIALSWLPAVKAALLPRGWTVYGFARSQCPAAAVKLDAVNNTTQSIADCTSHQAALASVVASVKPSLVLMSSTERTLDHLATGAKGSAAAVEYQAGLERAIRQVGAGRVVVLSPPPIGKSLLDCDTASAAPADCVSSPSNGWQMQSDADAAAAKATSSNYVDAKSWFCSSNGYCPAFVADVPMMYDGEHLTMRYARMLADSLESAVVK